MSGRQLYNVTSQKYMITAILVHIYKEYSCT